MIAPDEIDPYYKLRPDPATPEEEICRCPEEPPIVLQDRLSSVPLVCLKCGDEVQPERIGFDADLSERIANWRGLHRALFTLWVDAGDYEDWARTQLEDPQGQLNTRGIELALELNTHHRTYYWWFEDASATNFAPLTKCPRCYRDLVERFGHLVCELCSILVHGRD